MLIQYWKPGREFPRSVARKLNTGLVVLLFISIPYVCWGWQGRVATVPDGDTLSVVHDGKKETIRLYGIACPRMHQDFGQSAREFTSDRVSGKRVDVEPVGADPDGSTVAIVSKNGLVVNRQLLESGLAWVYRRDCIRPECPEWENIEEQARFRKIGLWSTPDPVPPWEFRYSGAKTATADKTESETAAPAEARGRVIYHGNVSSKIFHAPDCKYYNCRHCSVEFQSKEEAWAAGYRPDSGCVK